MKLPKEVFGISQPNPFAEHDSYWRIDDRRRERQRLRRDERALREELKKFCTKDHTNQTRQEMVLLLRRADHGLMCYAHSSVEELKHFMKTRHIKHHDMVGSKTVKTRQHESAEPVRRGLCATLDQADAVREFHKFLELPPELRAVIYGYYLAPFVERPLHAPTMPPLARLNRLVRCEVLPLFFERCTFDIQLVQTGIRVHPGVLYPVHIKPETDHFFATIDSKDIARIRKLRIYAKAQNYTTGDGAIPTLHDTMVCNVTLAKKGTAFEISCKHEREPSMPPHLERATTRMKRELDKTLRELVNGETGALKKMGWRDLQALKRAVEKAWIWKRPTPRQALSEVACAIDLSRSEAEE